MTGSGRQGPLLGLRVVELAGLGPAPFAAMLLADMGADVVRVDRMTTRADAREVLARSRRSIAIDLKSPEGVEVVLRLAGEADALIEGFRPGVAERLGIGPDECRVRNPRLVYGRMTGWGQEGPYSSLAGHDINYLSLTGALDAMRRVGERPSPPLNLVGDFGGGGMLMAFGLVCGIHEAQRSGLGQVIDAAMVDGISLLSTSIWGMRGLGLHNGPPGTNMFDSGAPFYDAYETADGKFLALGPVESKFNSELCAALGIDDVAPHLHHAEETWPARKERLTEVIRTRTRDEWAKLLEGTDACATPVLSFDEAPEHPHNQARATFVRHDGVVQPAPAPRFDRTPGAIQSGPAAPGAHSDEILREWLGIDDAEIDRLRAQQAMA